MSESASASASASAAAAEDGSELAEVLEEHETHVDMEKMLSLATHGVPERLRAEAWKYMLGVSRPERAEEMSLRKRMESEHKEVCACNAYAKFSTLGIFAKSTVDLC